MEFLIAFGQVYTACCFYGNIILDKIFMLSLVFPVYIFFSVVIRF